MEDIIKRVIEELCEQGSCAAITVSGGCYAKGNQSET